MTVVALLQLGNILATAITQCLSISILLQHTVFMH
jgi:hypothetical protein